MNFLECDSSNSKIHSRVGIGKQLRIERLFQVHVDNASEDTAEEP